MKNFVAALALVLGGAVSAVAAPVTYAVNHTIGSGSVVGSIETDGTIGTLSTANILNWTLTLSSPNLTSPNPDTFSAAGNIFAMSGTAFSATVSDLWFDWGANDGSYFFFQNSSNSHAWCAAAGPSPSCIGESTPSDGIYFNSAGGWAELSNPSTREAIASATTAVPEPTSVLLVAVALLGLACTRRRA